MTKSEQQADSRHNVIDLVGNTPLIDPFIVISFGRRVFKTSWRKHTLNPEFNEYAAFEVFPHETNFAFSIKVVDKDSFSFNDDVAKCELAWFDMLQQQQHENEWIPYEIPLDRSHC